MKDNEQKNISFETGTQITFLPPAPPVKIVQRPDAPANTRDVKRKWKNLLQKAEKKLIRFHGIPEDFRRDIKGTFAYVYPNFFLVAKGYIWKGTVSIHKKLINEALENIYNRKIDRKIVMYIDATDSFYEFDPCKILQYYRENGNIEIENTRGIDPTQKMVNFEIEKVGYNLVFQEQPTLEFFK